MPTTDCEFDRASGRPSRHDQGQNQQPPPNQAQQETAGEGEAESHEGKMNVF